jgi:hypothetical protein
VLAFGGTGAAAPATTAAAPFDALAYNGMQVNGSMEVSQENGGNNIAVAATTKYIVDGWKVSSVGAGAVYGLQNPSVFPPGYTKSLQIGVTTANAAPAAGDYCDFMHLIEGYRVARLGFGTANAQSISFGFWIYTNRAGNYSGAVLNGASNRSYVFSFTVNAVATWEYKTITVPGDTAGTWAKDNTSGLNLVISMMAGTTYQTTAGVWTAGVFLGATGTTNGVATTSDTMLITGLIVLPGIELPSAARAPLIMRPYDQELRTCQRYWSSTYSGGNLPGTATHNGVICAVGINSVNRPFVTWSYPAIMRTTPTVTLYSSQTGATANCYDVNSSTNRGATVSNNSANSVTATITDGSQAPLGNLIEFHFVADARL